MAITIINIYITSWWNKNVSIKLKAINDNVPTYCCLPFLANIAVIIFVFCWSFISSTHWLILLDRWSSMSRHMRPMSSLSLLTGALQDIAVICPVTCLSQSLARHSSLCLGCLLSKCLSVWAGWNTPGAVHRFWENSEEETKMAELTLDIPNVNS